MRIVVIGNGPAAIAAVEAVRARDRDAGIVMIAKEDVPFYSPCPLAEYVEESVPREHLFLRGDSFYRDNGIDLLAGRPATRIDATWRGVRVGVGNGATWVAYDRLLIASGAAAIMPPIPGLASTPGVFELKTLGDAENIIEWIPYSKRAVVIGSGFIGLEAAQGLVRRGLRVTVVEAQTRVLPQMLDAEVSALVETRLCNHGIEVHLNCAAQEVRGDAKGVTHVVAGGREIPCDLVVCAAGVRPDLSFLADSGIATGRGVLVNEYMETNLPGVYAAGDVVEGFDHLGCRQVLPIWPNAVNGGRVAGANMMAPRCRRLRGLDAINVVRIFDLAVASFGATSGARELRRSGPGFLRKLAIDHDRLVGAQFYGDVDATGIYHEMMVKGVDLGGAGDEILSPDFGYGYFVPPPPITARSSP